MMVKVKTSMVKPYKLLWAAMMLTGSIFTLSCSTVSKTPEFRIIADTLLTGLPSGSGLVVYNDRLLVVGDDASGFFERAVNSTSFTFHPFLQEDSLYRIAKELKYDPESLATIHVEGTIKLIAFGSGSGTSFRNNIYLIDPQTKTSQMFDGSGLYALIREQNNIGEADFNLEAAFARGDKLYIFNRGNNGIIQMDVDDLMHYLEGHNHTLLTNQVMVPLPHQAAGQPRFSGATALGKKHILFCASIEQTTDWMKDGAVGGSFIGLLKQQRDGYELLSMLPLQQKGKPLIEKLESIDVAEKLRGTKYRIYAISDNDNGTSRLFELELH